jgi:hypothetical protein
MYRMKQERNVPAFFIDVGRGKAAVHERVQIQLIVANVQNAHLV